MEKYKEIIIKSKKFFTFCRFSLILVSDHYVVGGIILKVNMTLKHFRELTREKPPQKSLKKVLYFFRQNLYIVGERKK